MKCSFDWYNFCKDCVYLKETDNDALKVKICVRLKHPIKYDDMFYCNNFKKKDNDIPNDISDMDSRYILYNNFKDSGVEPIMSDFILYYNNVKKEVNDMDKNINGVNVKFHGNSITVSHPGNNPIQETYILETEMREKISELKKQNEELKRCNDNQKHTIDSLMQKLDEQESIIKRKENYINTLEPQAVNGLLFNDLKTTNENLSKSVKHQQDTIKELRNEINNLLEVIAKLKDDKVSMASRIFDLEKEVENASNMIDDAKLRAQVSNLKRRVELLTDISGKKTSRLHRATNTIHLLEKRILQLENEIECKDNDITALLDQLEERDGHDNDETECINCSYRKYDNEYDFFYCDLGDVDIPKDANCYEE